ncbi:hypothetical protein H0A36_13860 [Endozoicomonas sp. SM1973]|uniref:Uncharacterized protein n=1 Tax=Spartinivicinus marinus TaxID=2994442 RepID=A0A853IB91_9GAMM|nr:hypothetical protein [Spartinivicinus marinus]MCX4028632.1 hypothetical protein [Spartinivicinus marinus]NYZ67101.1 hypothetical protein [Spartinivicinus marinus]
MKILKYLTIAISTSLPLQLFATPNELEVFNDSDKSIDMQIHGKFIGHEVPAEIASSISWSNLKELCNAGASNTISISADLCAAEVYLSPNTLDQKALGIILINLVRGNIIIVRQDPVLTGYQIVPYGNGQLLIENTQ